MHIQLDDTSFAYETHLFWTFFCFEYLLFKCFKVLKSLWLLKPAKKKENINIFHQKDIISKRKQPISYKTMHKTVINKNQ